ncbi:dystonin isoform X5 [Gouania willdenowi]|uniref:dystonin isoform X5 n=1 Tax=Gouania willdenowi TaxID=441366 RepID=UPI001055B133|nr:dystonin isoform X5 [Gouania willdenowi]
MMIAAVFLVLFRPYSVQCALLILLLLLATVATILFFCCLHRRLRTGKHPIKSVLSGRSRSRVGLRSHHFRSEGFRHSPRHSRRSIHARVTEEKSKLVEVPESEPDPPSTLRKRKAKKRVPPEFYHTVQVTPTRKPSSSSGNLSLHCSMSSSADISDDDDYSVKSGSASPAPGDTLPWNLPRHERYKRKIQGGSVLDPAERAVLRIADERDRVQKKTFTKWINQHLLKVRKHINDLYEDLRDGHNLISLLEVLSGDKLPRERDLLKTLRLPRERGRMRFHRLQNVQIALDYLKRRQVKLVNIRNDDITDGNPKLTLGLIWTIILHFQISEIHVTGESEDMTAKERLLLWSKQITEGYVGVRCDNFTTSWRDGRLFNAIIHKYRPDLIDISRVSAQTNRSNLEQAFCVGEQLGVARLLDPEDVDVQSPDEKSVITYVSTLYDAFPKVPDDVEGINANDVDIKWVEYQNMIKYLSQWIKHNVALMSDRSFPNNPVELKALYTQYLQFKEHEIPVKENEKTKIQNLYKMLEMWIEFGRIQLPLGHHPNDVEKEWGKLIVAMLEREKSLRPEVERLEMLQQIANRVQRDCVNGEDKLAVARTALQSDKKRLESGIQFLNEAEVANYLLDCENILRQQVVDIQILLDGKFPFADQLLQRISKLRDELLELRADCSSVYSRGRALTAEQTKMMISGISQSLNFSPANTSLTSSHSPALTPGGFVTSGSTFTSCLTPSLTPSLTPVLTPGLQPTSFGSYMGSRGGGVDSGGLMHIKHMQIRKPLLKSSLADSNMTEEEVNMKYVQDLLNWVEEMQLQLDRSEWGSDLPSVEMHLENHKSVHRAIEDFQPSLKEARMSEIQMDMPLKLTFSDKLSKLEKQYTKLVSCSRDRQSHLESLQDFVSQATQELIWLNEKEEEEVAFDWSDRHSHISKKRDYHADLMRELDEKEGAIKSVQEKADRLMLKNHPARLTIEAYRAAMQTQWNWILQLCSCVEQHLKENAVYFEFFSDAKESADYLKSMQDSIQRKYSCDRMSSLHRLEDLIQESMDEKEQLLSYRNTVAGLMGRAKNIVQLRPRNPENPLRSSIPVKAICDYRQIEITIYKDDECVLANNSHRAKWKVINPAGNEAMVPSVCFTVPPPNKEAVDMAARTEQLYQNVLALWHHSHINMKSVVSWHYLMANIRTIRNWNVASIKTMLPGEHQQVLSNLETHFDEFLEDSRESEVFTVADCSQLERDVAACKDYYQELLKSAEREEHEESVYNNYISEIHNLRMHLEAHEERLIRKIRSPLERVNLEQSLRCITEHEEKIAELNKLNVELDVVKERCDLFLRQAAGSASVPMLSSELSILIQSMNQVYSMSSIYMDKLKTVNLVLQQSQNAEALVKAYESKLYEEDAMNSDIKSIEHVISTLKQWRMEIDETQEVFHDLEDELQKARVISDRMFKAHNERDFDLDWHKEKADQLSERWQNIHSHIDSRLRDLEGISKSLKHYKESFSSLDEWVREMEAAQLKTQENKGGDSKAITEMLNKQKNLVAEIEQKQGSMEECQKYSDQYSSAIKNYELQLMTFRAMVDSQHKSPLKKRRIQSSSDAIQQEFMDLRTRYTALVTLMTQCVKFASETLRRTEDEERSVDEEKREHGDKVSKLLHWMSNVKQSMDSDGNALKDSNANTDAANKPQVSVEEMVTKKEQIAEALRNTQMMLNKHSDKMTKAEEEAAQEQLQALNQAYNELSQQYSDQTTSPEEDHKTGFREDMMDQIPTIPPSDSVKTSFHVNSEPRVHPDCDDTLKHEQASKSTVNHYPKSHEASKHIQSSNTPFLSSNDKSAAAGEASMCNELVIKLIEVGHDIDGVRVGYTGETMTLEEAFHCNLISASVYDQVLKKQRSTGRVHDRQKDLCEVNRMILNCLSANPPLTSERNFNTLKLACGGLSEESGDEHVTEVSESTGSFLKVDVAVQCDLMSSSSALIVLGNQQQFVGLVLPRFEENPSVSDQHISCKLFDNQGKVAAFYIPESSEVIDVNSAIQRGLIDINIAHFLTSIKIPNALPDVDRLNEKVSSWLVYKRLMIEQPHHTAGVELLSNSEAKQLFLSYLMKNSFLDCQSSQRVVKLNRQLTEMTQIFLEDSVFLDDTDRLISDPDPDCTANISLHINEDTEDVYRSTTYTSHNQEYVPTVYTSLNLDENMDEASESHSLISSDNSKATLKPDDGYTYLGDENNFDNDTVEPVSAAEDELMFQYGPLSNELEEYVSEIFGHALEDSDTLTSTEMTISPTLFSGESTDSPFVAPYVPSSNEIQCHCRAESPYSESGSVDSHQAGFLCYTDLSGGENEADKRGILDSNSAIFNKQQGSPDKELFNFQSNEATEETVVRSESLNDSFGFIGDTDVTSVTEWNTLNVCPAGEQQESACSVSQLPPLGFSKEEQIEFKPKSNLYSQENAAFCLPDECNVELIQIDEAETQSHCRAESPYSEPGSVDSHQADFKCYKDLSGGENEADKRGILDANCGVFNEQQGSPNKELFNFQSNETTGDTVVRSEMQWKALHVCPAGEQQESACSVSQLPPLGFSKEEQIEFKPKSNLYSQENPAFCLPDECNVELIQINEAETSSHCRAESPYSESGTVNAHQAGFLGFKDLSGGENEADEREILDPNCGIFNEQHRNPDTELFHFQSNEATGDTDVRSESLNDSSGSIGDTDVTFVMEWNTLNVCPSEEQQESVFSFSQLPPLGFNEEEHIEFQPKCNIYSQENAAFCLPDECNIELTQHDEAENMFQPTERKVACVLLDLPTEQEHREIQEEKRHDCRPAAEMMSHYVDFPLLSDSDHSSQMISPSPWSQDSAESIHQLDKAQVQKEASGSLMGIDNCSAATAQTFSVQATHSASSSLSDIISPISTNNNCQTQHESFTYTSDKSDSQPADGVFHCAALEADGEGRNSHSSINHSVLSLETGMDDDNVVQSALNNEPAHISYSLSKDSLETASLQIPTGNSRCEKDKEENSNRDLIPQQALVHSEWDPSVESEPSSSPCSHIDTESSPQHNAASSHSPDIVGDTFTANTCRELSSGSEQSVVTNKESDKVVNELSTVTQQKDTCDDAEQISAPNPHCLSSDVDLNQSGSDVELYEGREDDLKGICTQGIATSFLLESQHVDTEDTSVGDQNKTMSFENEASTQNDLNKGNANSQILEDDGNCSDTIETPDTSNNQLQPFQPFKAASTSPDPSVLQEVIDYLDSALDGHSQEEEGCHILESITEESSEGEEEAAEADSGFCQDDAKSHQTCLGSDIGKDEAKFKQQFFIQDYLECVGRLQDHADVLEDVRNDLIIQAPVVKGMEDLQFQIEECQSLESHLNALAAVLTADMEKAEQLLHCANEDIPSQIVQDLATTYLELKPNFTAVSQMCAEKGASLIQALEVGKNHLELTYQKHLADLEELAGLLTKDSDFLAVDLTSCDADKLKHISQQNKALENHLLTEARPKLEDVTFDIQCFISENAHFLSPSQSSYLLKVLSSTQRALREQIKRVAEQRSNLDVVLDAREQENQEKSLLDKHKGFSAKLEEMCDRLMLTENQLMGHQQQAESTECISDLQQYQQEHQALQKDVSVNASALNEVISSTQKFLEENQSKLTPDQLAIIENKLEEAKIKAELINQRAEESRNDLEKVVTTAIKQESEKAATLERLEESKNKIEGLLGWISNIENQNNNGRDQTDHICKENGNVPEESPASGLMGKDDNANGNDVETTDKYYDGQVGGKSDASCELNEQHDRVKAHHQEILSQQQDLIMATQSTQALLDKQANILSPEEKEKLQKKILDLKERYEASLTQAEQQMKQVQCVQEELKKFQDDCGEFQSWLNQAEVEVEELSAPTGSLDVLRDKLEQQKSFSEDVISHKGDLRFITISGQKVLDVAKACGLSDPAAANDPQRVDTSGTCSSVKEKLDSAASRYKSLHSQCNLLGNSLREVVDKYKKYDDSSTGLLKWLSCSEEEARKQQSEVIAADPQTLQKQLEETKALQGQMSGHQTAVDTLRKTAELLITSEGDLLSNTDEIQETVDDIVERYDNLSKSVSDRNEKLQITLTRSMSVQDGLDEMMDWMERVEASVKENGQIPLDSASIGDILSKEAALEQDIASRLSSISAMKAKVKAFVETADPSAAALLQSKMNTLSQRFSDACDKHKQKASQLEQLRGKVEEFEKGADKVQQFVVKRSEILQDTDGPAKTFNELFKLVQDTRAEMIEHADDLEKLQCLSKELSETSSDKNRAQIQSKMDNVTNLFSTFKENIKEKEKDLSSCQDHMGEFRSAASALRTWLEETNEKLPAVQTNGDERSPEKSLHIITGLLDEWTSKGPAVQDLNNKGLALCSLITFLTSPAKMKTNKMSALTNGGDPASHAYLTNKELMMIQQNMTHVSEGYANLGETLRCRAEQLNSLVKEEKEAQNETEDMMTWLREMKKSATSWNGKATEKESVKSQLEQQKAFEDDMKKKGEQLQKLREKILSLIKTNPNSPESAKWKQLLAEIDATWAEVNDSVEERKQHLETSNMNLDIFQSTELQLSQWLSEKGLMMSVLGPLSIDPNMLKMQKQQVQILQNEFNSRKPQLEKLEEAATAIVSSGENNEPSSGKLVREQLFSINQKWQGLTGELDQRDNLIDQAVVKTGQFQELLQCLGHSVTQLDDQLSNCQSHTTQPEAVKKQLEDTQNISAQLREERKKLKEAEAVNAELMVMVTEDYLKADLARQLENVSKPFRQLEEKAAKRIEQLTSTFDSSQQFHQTSKDFQSWLSEQLLDQSKPLSISAKTPILQQTLAHHSQLQKTVGEHEESYNTIIGEGEMLLLNTDGAEKLALQGQLTSLSSNWEDVKRSCTEQADKLQTALLRSQKYQEQAEKLSSWIQECEASEGRVKLTADPAAVETSVSQVKALQKDVDKHRGMVEQLNTAANSLLEVANADTEAVKEDKSSISRKVEDIMEGLQNKREDLERISRAVKEFNEAFKDAKGHLEEAEKQLDSFESQGTQAHNNKNLTNMKAQQKSLEGVHNQVEHMKTLAKDLVVDLPDAEGVMDLLLQADDVEKDYKNLNRKLEETCQVMEAKLQGIGQFQNSIREMFTQFTELDDELDSMSSVDLDLATLKAQQEGIQSFMAKLQKLMASTANAGDNCKKMLESETSPDLLGLKRDLDALNKHCGKLLDRAKSREIQVQATLTKLEEVYGKVQQAEERLSGAVDKEAAQEPVGMETDVINQQLEAFKAFQKEDIDPLQAQLQDINSLGQSLIQKTAKGTSTKKLEDDLEDVNSKWNTLNKKIAERSAQLHEALLHCGRFQDALESLLCWLTDTEELVANQKPPSSEFKVVKAQIQEQKLLQRLLDDRKPTVELIKNEGGKVAELAESVDKEKVAKEIECLGQRWDALLKKAENRHKQLESILVVTQQFHETLEPLSEWLVTTEKQLANSEPIGTETSKLEHQISQHKALEEEIMNHSKDLFQVVNLGQMLKTVSSVGDKEYVESKLDAIQASYIEVQERCRRKAEMLHQALANARLFGEDEVALMNWLSEMHSRLSEVSVDDHKLDVLKKQLAEQRSLQSDIDLRKRNVDQAVSNGMELLKHITGDDVVIVQGKLDGIKSKYAAINSMSDNVLTKLERVLSLSSKLQHTHEDLHSWLVKAEAAISNFAEQQSVGEQLIQSQRTHEALLKETKDQKTVLDKLNELSGSLLDLIPWHTRESLDKLVIEDNERYRVVCDTITQQVNQINSDILKSQQFEEAANNELSWLSDAERKLVSMGEIKLELDQTTAQLQAQKIFSMDIMRHKDAVDDIVKTGNTIMKSKKTEEREILEAKTETLLEKYGVVSQLNSERCLLLEQAQSLAAQFWETYEELSPWLQETLTTFSQLSPPAIEYETLRQQQEELRQLRELIAEHKPHIDKMNKTGPQLFELSPVEGASIKEKYINIDQLYTKLKADVKQRAATLDEAISKSTQFHDKIDPMLESLERIAERLRQPPSISVEVDKIKEQITENKVVSVDLEKLQPSYETLRQRGDEMIARSEGAENDISAKAVQNKLDHMVLLWNDVQALVEEREAKLLDVMDLADKFWCDHCALIANVKDSQELLRDLEEPGVDPSVVKQQQEFVEGFKEEIDGLQEELDAVQNQGAELMTACGEPDKPVIKKSLDEVNTAWENLNKTWKERVDRLEEAMLAAVQFQDGLQGMFDWVDILEGKLDSMSPVGTDLETVKQQIVELKEFKGESYQLQIEMERLNHQAGLLLKKVTDEADSCAIQEPMSELKMLWDNLDEKIISRQHKLEGGLLALGQFQHALDELLAWMSHTEEMLNEQKQACGDPKTIEIELAKHHILQIDVLAHKATMETVNKAGEELVQSSAGEEASSLKNKLENLNQRWKTILEKTEQRKQQLESSLFQAQGFHGEIEDMQQWLKDTERQLLASKAVGGLPDTAREQLNAHLELLSAFEAKEELYQELLNKGHHLLTMTPEGPDSTTEHDLSNLKDKWEAVEAKVAERKVKLEGAFTMATDFHNSLQDFVNWLTQAEQTLNMVSPASLILETIMFQIDEHKMFVTEVNSHRDHIIELDKTGTHLKYFSQKQDVVLIKNLLLSVQGRWEKVVQRSVERGRLLDDARKRAKQFHETFHKLMEWLEDSEKSLDSEVEIANEPDKLKVQLAQHKEFQKALGSKHSVYDTTARTGRALKDKTSLQDDNQKLDDMLCELRDKWDTVCGKSVERQNKLEEALLFSGQFTDALQALVDWLYRIEPQLAEDQPVHGDIDLVLNLIDSHKVFQKELGKRKVGVQALKRSARELIESSHDDSFWVKVQMQELSTRWETVCSLSVSKQARLEQALCQAEEFHSTVHILLEWLAEAEQSLRFHGSLPDDEDALCALIDQHKEFIKKLEEKHVAITNATSKGEGILSLCHPDSITTIKHWNTILKARFEEVQAWARQHQQRLSVALTELIATQELLDKLLTWLQYAETNLNTKDKELLPQEIEEVKSLIAEHQAFMEEMTRKQPDVDKITKTHKRKAIIEPQVQSQIPVLGKGRTGRKRSPTQTMYTSAAQAAIETKNPQVNLLVTKWQHVWLLALDRRRKLNDALDRLEELKEFANFDFDVWRKRYMRWMNHKKSRVMDFFRRIDKDQDGKVTRQEFIEGILSSKFPTSRLEMSAVADIFDRDGDGYIDYYEFVAALHPNKDAYKPLTDADKIEDEVTRQVAKCKCPKRFQVEQIGANKYRFYLGNQFGLVHCLHDSVIGDETIANRENQNLTPHLHVAVLESCILFGDSQQLRLVRILRSTVMVRVGGGWMALDEFLVKNDPCRVHHHGSKMLRSESNSSITQSPIGWQISHFLTLLHEPTSAKGRTNMELREKFMVPEGTTQVMASFRYRGRRSRPSSRGASPNRSMSTQSYPVPLNPAMTSTPKPPQHITRNYDKPWLTNSKPSTPVKSSDSFESQGSSSESAAVQGSKLRLPGYLSGKGFQSAEEGTLIKTAVLKARTQATGELRKNSSRPGSKAGSRGSSRRGSDASDFDISDIQSVCSDMSETVGDSTRATPRSASRQHGVKPTKIPTPQKRTTSTSKLARGPKR